MSNHSSDNSNPPDAMLRKFMEQLNHPLGPTGDHPNGRMTPTDEGGIRFAVGSKNGVVIVDFGKAVAWVGMPPIQARQLAESLIKHADAIEPDARIFETAARARDVK